MILYDPKLFDRDTLLITGSYRMGGKYTLGAPAGIFFLLPTNLF